MVDIYRLNAFCTEAVYNCENLGSHVLVSSEAELKDLIADVKYYPLLVCVLPESKGDDEGYDNYVERNSGLFYIIKPMLETFNKQDRLDLWMKTQFAMREFKYYIRKQMLGGDEPENPNKNNFMDLFKDADLAGRDQQPEYNLMGCAGWSLNFMYSTDGM